MNMSVTEIVTLAANLKRTPPKKEAFAMLREAVENGGQMDEHTAAALWAYFLPAAPKRAKSSFGWVGLAVSDRHDPREYLRLVYCDGARIIATNGHRLHMAPSDGRAAGYYHPATGDRVDIDARYPDVDRVIPGLESLTVVTPDLDNLEATEIGNAVAVNIHGDIWVNRAYLQAAINGNPPAAIRVSGKDGPVRLDWPDGRMAVIMPIRI